MSSSSHVHKEAVLSDACLFQERLCMLARRLRMRPLHQFACIGKKLKKLGNWFMTTFRPNDKSLDADLGVLGLWMEPSHEQSALQAPRLIQTLVYVAGMVLLYIGILQNREKSTEAKEIAFDKLGAAAAAAVMVGEMAERMGETDGRVRIDPCAYALVMMEIPHEILMNETMKFRNDLFSPREQQDLELSSMEATGSTLGSPSVSERMPH